MVDSHPLVVFSLVSNTFNYDTKTDDAEAAVGEVPVAEGRTQVVRIGEPGPAAQHAFFTFHRSLISSPIQCLQSIQMLLNSFWLGQSSSYSASVSKVLAISSISRSLSASIFLSVIL